MEAAELIEIISRGEDSRHQFKADVNNADSLAAEIVAFSNSGGGRMFIGVSDDNKIVGLSAEAVGRINQLLSNASSQNVRPAVNPLTENVAHPDGTVMVVTVPDGVSKPYMDKNGVIWVKNGSDKRRATSREEIQRMFQSASLVHADETPVDGVGAGDVDMAYFEKFFESEYGEKLDAQKVPLPQLLENMNLAKAGTLNLAGTILFAKKPEVRLPAFVVKAVSFAGNDIAGENYLDSRDITGRVADMFQQCVGFVLANTSKPQGDQSVNSTGEFEVPRIVWEELIANALIHRNYFVSAPIRLLVFSDRVEIISPGHLPNNLTIANVKAGNSNIRNPILASFAAKLLPYRGLGSGVLRAIKAYPDIELIDDRDGNLFKVVVKRAGGATGI
jgi:ATP-dependent DNA helicase RecG